MGRQIDLEKHRPTDREADRQTKNPTDRQTDICNKYRQADRRTDKHVKTIKIIARSRGGAAATGTSTLTTIWRMRLFESGQPQK